MEGSQGTCWVVPPAWGGNGALGRVVACGEVGRDDDTSCLGALAGQVEHAASSKERTIGELRVGEREGSGLPGACTDSRLVGAAVHEEVGTLAGREGRPGASSEV